jgi:hypothetical protein
MQEVLSLEDKLVVLLKRVSSINMDLLDIKNIFFTNVNRRVSDPEAQLFTSSTSESNCCISVLLPVEINQAPIDIIEITRHIGVTSFSFVLVVCTLISYLTLT